MMGPGDEFPLSSRFELFFGEVTGALFLFRPLFYPRGVHPEPSRALQRSTGGEAAEREWS